MSHQPRPDSDAWRTHFGQLPVIQFELFDVLKGTPWSNYAIVSLKIGEGWRSIQVTFYKDLLSSDGHQFHCPQSVIDVDADTPNSAVQLALKDARRLIRDWSISVQEKAQYPSGASGSSA